MSAIIKKAKKSLKLQHDQADCGIACLASVLNFYGAIVSFEALRKESGTTQLGTNLLGLSQGAKKFGLSAEGFQAEPVHLIELKEPAILHVLINKQMQHYVVYYGYNKGKFIIGDPARGVLELSTPELNEIWQSKTLLCLSPTQKISQFASKGAKRTKFFLDLISTDYSLLGIALTLGIFISVLGISFSIFTQKLIDQILPSGNSEKLFVSMALLLFVLLIKSGLSYLRTFILIKQSKDFNNRIIGGFYSALMYLPKLFFDNRKTGDMVARMNDTLRIQRTISQVIGNAIIDLLIVVTAIVFVGFYSWPLALIIAVVFIPVYAAIMIRYNPAIIIRQKEVMAAYASNESNYIDTIQGYEAIKTGNKEHFFIDHTKRLFAFFQNNLFNLGKLENKFGLTKEVVGVCMLISVTGFSAYQVIQAHMQIGEMIAVLTMISSIIPSLGRLSVINIALQEARVAFDRMFDFSSIEGFESKGTEIFEEPFDSLQVKCVSFSFPGQASLIEDISLNLRKNEMIALLGESGCGKSTFLRLLTQLYDLRSGDITINNTSCSLLNKKALRDQFSLVPQEIKIFSTSLLQNICMEELNEVRVQRIVDLCKQYGFDNYFEKFPQGYLTLLGEGGVNLSGGQKQLIGMARALYENAPILLLDEPTSAMDKKTEKFILELLQQLKKEKAILLVTHRIKSALHADSIYLLKEGKTKFLDREILEPLSDNTEEIYV